MEVISGCKTATENVLRKAEGPAREFVVKALGLFDKDGDIGEIWSGRKAGGRGSYKNAEFRASDALALARLGVARPIFAVAQKVAERAAERLGSSQDPREKLYLEGIQGYVAYVASRLKSAGDLIGAGFDGDINIVRPKMLPLGTRRRFWSAAVQAYNTVNRLPSAINRLLTGELGIDDFHQEMEETKTEDEPSGPKSEESTSDGDTGTETKDSALDDRNETPGETKESPAQVEIPSKVIKGTKSPASKKKAMAFFDENGGFPDLSAWFATKKTNGTKSVSLSGCNSDPEAAKAAMLAKVGGEKTTA